jgi:hypothetical protein
VEEEVDLGDDSARLGLQEQVEGDEGAPAVLFSSLAWRGVVGVVASVKLFELRSWCSGGEVAERGEKGERRREKLARVPRGGGAALFNGAGLGTACIQRGRRNRAAQGARGIAVHLASPYGEEGDGRG